MFETLLSVSATKHRLHDNISTSRAYTCNTKIDEFVCPSNISETVAVRIMKLTHHAPIASTTIKLISKPILMSIFINYIKNN